MSVDEPVGAWPPQAKGLAPVRSVPTQPVAAPPAPSALPEPPTGPLVTVTMTCMHDGRSHAVPDTELTGTTSGSGYYRAVCGHLVSAAPMVAPEGSPCRTCDETRQTKPARSPRRLGLRLLGG